MGYIGQHYGVALYRGERGLRSLLSIGMHEAAYTSMLYVTEKMQCLNCNFEAASELSAEEKQRVRSVSDRYGKPMSKRNSFPQFICYEPRKYPQPYYRKQDVEDMLVVLNACKDIAIKLEQESQEDLGFPSKNYIPHLDNSPAYPLLTPQADGSFSWSLKQPEMSEKESLYSFEQVKLDNDFMVARVANLPENGEWYVLPMQLFQPVEISDDEPLAYMRMYLLVDCEGMLFFDFGSEFGQ